VYGRSAGLMIETLALTRASSLTLPELTAALVRTHPALGGPALAGDCTAVLAAGACRSADLNYLVLVYGCCSPMASMETGSRAHRVLQTVVGLFSRFMHARSQKGSSSC
jgi:hypothetical protein